MCDTISIHDLIVRLLNIGTAKFLAVVLVIVLASYHSILHVTYGVTPCKGLLKNGMYKVTFINISSMTFSSSYENTYSIPDLDHIRIITLYRNI